MGAVHGAETAGPVKFNGSCPWCCRALPELCRCPGRRLLLPSRSLRLRLWLCRGRAGQPRADVNAGPPPGAGPETPGPPPGSRGGGGSGRRGRERRGGEERKGRAGGLRGDGENGSGTLRQHRDPAGPGAVSWQRAVQKKGAERVPVVLLHKIKLGSFCFRSESELGSVRPQLPFCPLVKVRSRLLNNPPCRREQPPRQRRAPLSIPSRFACSSFFFTVPVHEWRVLLPALSPALRKVLHRTGLRRFVQKA